MTDICVSCYQQALVDECGYCSSCNQWQAPPDTTEAAPIFNYNEAMAHIEAVTADLDARRANAAAAQAAWEGQGDPEPADTDDDAT